MFDNIAASPSGGDMVSAPASPDDSQAREHLLEIALNNISAGAALWGRDNKLVLANNRFYEIFGLKREEVPASCGIVEFSDLATNSDRLVGRDADDILGAHMGAVTRGRNVQYLDSWPNGMFVMVSYRKVGNELWLVSYEDVTKSYKAEREAKSLADHDSLTGLYNRRFFHDKLKELLARGRDISVFSIDLDRFKEVNDTLGHPFGDVILKAVSSRLLGHFRREDIVARLGGDEFAAIVAGVEDKESLLALSERVITVLSGTYAHDGHQVSIGASVGIARSKDRARNSETLLSRADVALYAAKKNGKGRACFFEEGMDSEIVVRRKIEEHLLTALAKHEMSLLYQPIIDVSQRSIAGAEALLRWKSPSLGDVSPATFVPIAESSGQILGIGAWVIKEALSDAAHWRSNINVSVNISPAQFCNDSLVPTVKSAIEKTGINPAKVTFEITESVLLKNNGRSADIMKKLRELGVSFSLDDFGTGYSSLSYLVDFQFDKIKIDKSFVDKIGSHAPSEAIIRAILRMTSETGVAVIAEGVENKEQLAWLSENGCRYIQGFLFSRPVASEKISNWKA